MSSKKHYSNSFKDRVLLIVAGIPKGSTLTYKEVALRAGSPGASRAVGNIMSKNLDPKKIPCHRVIRSDGKMGGYAFGGIQQKEALLIKEGALKV